MSAQLDLSQSLWSVTARPPATFPALEGSASADVVVIGGGFTGLSTALHLAEAGLSAIVLEADEPGSGASGRNNGQVIPTMTRPDPDHLVAAWGEAGERFVGLVRDSASLLFDTVRRLGLEEEAEAQQTGWVQPAHLPSRLKLSEARFRQWSKWGAPVELHDREAIRRITGSDAWFGGFSNPTGGSINPLGFARGLARKAAEAGVGIFARSPVARIERRPEGWGAVTGRGEVRAKALVLATNAYTDWASADLAPAVAQEVVPVHSWQLATEVVPEAVRATVLPGSPAMSDTHGDLHFARWDVHGRLVSGGALIFPQAGAARLRRRIGARLERLWPQLGRPKIEYVWNGYIAMTTDRLPRFHRLGPDAYAFAGCNGRGVALAIAVGREFAKAIGGAPDADLALPFGEPTPLPLHGLLRRIAPLGIVEYRIRDRF